MARIIPISIAVLGGGMDTKIKHPGLQLCPQDMHKRKYVWVREHTSGDKCVSKHKTRGEKCKCHPQLQPIFTQRDFLTFRTFRACEMRDQYGFPSKRERNTPVSREERREEGSGRIMSWQPSKHRKGSLMIFCVRDYPRGQSLMRSVTEEQTWTQIANREHLSIAFTSRSPF